MKDSFGRTIDNLRVSVTDRCNFRCRYCMPAEGMDWMPKRHLLTFEEIERLVRNFVSLGIAHVRLTGGEPLMRADLPALIRMLARVDGLRDISLTTNGFFLAEQAESLAAEGLQRVNVSIDSLDPERFKEIARRDYFHRVLEGVQKADALGMHPIKINTVIIRGVNDGEVTEFARLARSRPWIVRFIEFMPIGSGDGWTRENVVTAAEMRERIVRETGVALEAVPSRGAQPSDRYRFGDGRGEIGFINSVSEPFCGSCNRVRITADGMLRTCLFSHRETDLKELLRDGAGDDELRRTITAAVWRKEAGHRINDDDFVRPARRMSQIGG
jgi:GTP 3',8-cyclase